MASMPTVKKVVSTKFREDITTHGTRAESSSHNDSETSLSTLVESKDEHVQLTWRSWMVVVVTCFAQLAQVFVVAAAGQNIAFIARDLGDAELASWIIQAPLLMQAVLSPIVGRLSDVLDRKWLVSIPPLIACIGATISATASSMSTIIGGGVLVGVTLSTISIVQAIPSEILPRKYRAIANGAGFVGSGIGGIVGSLGAGKVTSMSTSGWRNIFWIQVALHGATCLGVVLFYHPPKLANRPRLSMTKLAWSLDPIGSGLFIVGTTLTLLALDWVSIYSWSSAHVIAPLSIGLTALLGFALYELKGRVDGILAHACFSPNFALATSALLVEGWIFYSAVNSVVPQLTLNLGFEDNAWSISVRQLSSSATTMVAVVPIVWYATQYKDVKTPLLATFVIFLAATICYAALTPKMNAAQVGYNVLVAVGQAGPLTLLVAIIQLVTPHEHLSTATGVAFSARAIGGAFGSAVLTAIINGKLNSNYAKDVGNAAMNAGLPESSVDAFLQALQDESGSGISSVPGLNEDITQEAVNASQLVYAAAYRLAWSSIIPFVVLAIVALACLRNVKDLMTEKVEAPIEHASKLDIEKVARQ